MYSTYQVPAGSRDPLSSQLRTIPSVPCHWRRPETQCAAHGSMMWRDVTRSHQMQRRHRGHGRHRALGAPRHQPQGRKYADVAAARPSRSDFHRRVLQGVGGLPITSNCICEACLRRRLLLSCLSARQQVSGRRRNTGVKPDSFQLPLLDLSFCVQAPLGGAWAHWRWRTLRQAVDALELCQHRPLLQVQGLPRSLDDHCRPLVLAIQAQAAHLHLHLPRHIRCAAGASCSPCRLRPCALSSRNVAHVSSELGAIPQGCHEQHASCERWVPTSFSLSPSRTSTACLLKVEGLVSHAGNMLPERLPYLYLLRKGKALQLLAVEHVEVGGGAATWLPRCRFDHHHRPVPRRRRLRRQRPCRRTANPFLAAREPPAEATLRMPRRAVGN